MAISHDVFLCFRDNDAAVAGFASHLSAALLRRQIKVFKEDDDDVLGRGIDDITIQLLHAVSKSKINVVIFDQDFISSTWCLTELVEIIRSGQTVIPVFYNVKPSDVRRQTGSLEMAYDVEERYGEETVQTWKDALNQAAFRIGFVSSHRRDEAELVEQIAEAIKNRLRFTEIKDGVEIAFVVINFVLELFSAVFDQLSSVQKPIYALVGMLTALVSVIFCLVELIHKGRTQRVKWQWSPVPWFYNPSPSSKSFGSFLEIVGAFCAVCQFAVTAVNYCFIRLSVDGPIKISVWPLIFAFGLLCSSFLK